MSRRKLARPCAARPRFVRKARVVTVAVTRPGGAFTRSPRSIADLSSIGARSTASRGFAPSVGEPASARVSARWMRDSNGRSEVRASLPRSVQKTPELRSQARDRSGCHVVIRGIRRMSCGFTAARVDTRFLEWVLVFENVGCRSRPDTSHGDDESRRHAVREPQCLWRGAVGARMSATKCDAVHEQVQKIELWADSSTRARHSCALGTTRRRSGSRARVSNPNTTRACLGKAWSMVSAPVEARLGA